MENSTLVLIIVVAVLLIALALTAWGMTRRTRRAREALEAAQRDHSSQASALSERHASETRQLQQQHDAALAELTARSTAQSQQLSTEYEAQQSRLQTERDAAVRMSAEAQRLAGQGMRWELASRELLVDACTAAGLDAIVATNIVFSPHDDEAAAPYCVQLDHLVITEKAITVVDSKNWKGLIFDGRKPSSMAGALSVLFDEAALPTSFAISLRRDGAGSVSVRSKFGAESPAFQVRRQARRFHGHLAARHGSAPYLQTCVFYSHPDARVWTDGLDEGERGRATRIASARTIQKVLLDAQSAGSAAPSSHQLTQLVDTVRELGADLHGTGRFASEFVSPVALTLRVPPRGARVVPSTPPPSTSGPRMTARRATV
ncbi:nuclease-related domain-containing protein [Microbacterium sp. 22242]|uniref:nuclease-related domain-containing protein n=1 Tax=Microbacterium sp. 22242 TaxID=3453896 RepID=UPI003F86286F